MQSPDLNLLFALDVLLEEGSVVGAARRMNLSAPAMSRTLARIRNAIGDPVFVKVGRKMVPTPYALSLRERVHSSVEGARQLLQPERAVDLASLKRHFNLHANDVFLSAFGQTVLGRVRSEAPQVVLRFAPESESEDSVLRDGKVDLYISAMRPMGPDVHIQTLFTTRFVGLARADHPIFDAEITPQRFASYGQISVSRRAAPAGRSTRLCRRWVWRARCRWWCRRFIPACSCWKPPTDLAPERTCGRRRAAHGYPGTRLCLAAAAGNRGDGAGLASALSERRGASMAAADYPRGLHGRCRRVLTALMRAPDARE